MRGRATGEVSGEAGRQAISRRFLMRLSAAAAGLTATFAVGGGRAQGAVICAPRGGGCGLLRPCCDGSACHFFGVNPFVGICPGHGALARLRDNRTLWTPDRLRRGLTATCDDFSTQREVRRFLRRNPDFDSSRLESGRNGRFCRNLPLR